NLHLRRLADDDEIRPQPFGFGHLVRCNAVAPLLHVAEVIAGDAFQQPQFLGQRQTIDHARRAALLVAGPARKEHAVLDLTLERVPFPFVRVADTYRIDVAVVEQLDRAIADLADDIAHPVEPDVIKAELTHFGFGALAHRANLAVIAGNGAQFAQEGDNVLALFLYPLANLLNFVL